MKQEPAIDFNIVQSILDFLPMGVYVINRERKMRWVNRRIMERLQDGNVSSIRKILL
jgi:c-di-AMP phosphodiesterase-like protein